MAKIYTNVNSNESSREKIEKGIEALTNAVVATLGPGGKNVAIEQIGGKYHITKDGVTVAKSINLADPIEDLGVQIIKEAAKQTNDEAGDGTTTATLLSQVIYKESQYYIDRGENPILIKRQLDELYQDIAQELSNMSTDVSGIEDLERVASISANGDKNIGKLIGKAFHYVGQDGAVLIEEGNGIEDSLNIVDGYQINSGFLSPYFVTDNNRMETHFKDPYILIYDGKLSQLKPAIKILESVIQQNRPLLVIAHDVDGETLAALILNKIRQGKQFAAIKAPEFGERRTQYLEDIAAITGGTVISPKKGMKLESITLSDLGRAKSIRINKKKTYIVDGSGDEESVKNRIEELESLISESDSNYEKEKLKDRLAKIGGNVAIIEIGASSEIELKEKKDRMEDALHATRAAIQEGIVPGGGNALYQIHLKMKNAKSPFSQSNGYGYQVLEKALLAPISTIISNSGESPKVILPQLDSDKGYDAARKIVVNDLISEGIIDPVKVTRTALEKAISVAGTLITTDYTVTMDRDNKPNYDLDHMGGGFGIQ